MPDWKHCIVQKSGWGGGGCGLREILDSSKILLPLSFYPKLDESWLMLCCQWIEYLKLMTQKRIHINRFKIFDESLFVLRDVNWFRGAPSLVTLSYVTQGPIHHKMFSDWHQRWHLTFQTKPDKLLQLAYCISM